MKGVRELRRRLKGVRSIRKITKAMEMVAATKLRRLQDRALATRPFAGRIEALMRRTAQVADPAASPLLVVPESVSVEALVVVGADKGLCGSYNSNLFRALVQRLSDLQREGVRARLFVYGRRAQLFASKLKGPELAAAWPEPVEKLDYRAVKRALLALVREFEAGTVQRVAVLYTRMRTMASFSPTAQVLLPVPVPAAADAAPGVDVLMEPTPERILARLLPRYLEMQLYAAVLESLASEFASRRMAMKNATDNADEMTTRLTMEYNKARQSGITGELLEIVGGAEALKG
jgi:F-type H+-transporting ATPase subunit gamma